MSFEHTLTARFFEIDRAGIVFFGRFFEYSHAAFEELLLAVTGDLESFFRTAEWGAPLVHAEADFERPVRIGDRLRIVIDIEKLGRSSMTLAFQIVGSDGAVRARVRQVHACIDVASFKSRPWPPAFLEGLQRAGLELPAQS